MFEYTIYVNGNTRIVYVNFLKAVEYLAILRIKYPGNKIMMKARVIK